MESSSSVCVCVMLKFLGLQLKVVRACCSEIQKNHDLMLGLMLYSHSINKSKSMFGSLGDREIFKR